MHLPWCCQLFWFYIYFLFFLFQHFIYENFECALHIFICILYSLVWTKHWYSYFVLNFCDRIRSNTFRNNNFLTVVFLIFCLFWKMRRMCSLLSFIFQNKFINICYSIGTDDIMCFVKNMYRFQSKAKTKHFI